MTGVGEPVSSWERANVHAFALSRCRPSVCTHPPLSHSVPLCVHRSCSSLWGAPSSTTPTTSNSTAASAPTTSRFRRCWREVRHTHTMAPKLERLLLLSISPHPRCPRQLPGQASFLRCSSHQSPHRGRPADDGALLAAVRL